MDNDEAVCEALRPTLSSIATDNMSMWNGSLKLLEQIISGEPPENRPTTSQNSVFSLLLRDD